MANYKTILVYTVVHHQIVTFVKTS